MAASPVEGWRGELPFLARPANGAGPGPAKENRLAGSEVAEPQRKNRTIYRASRRPLHYDCGRPERLEVSAQDGSSLFLADASTRVVCRSCADEQRVQTCAGGGSART